MKKYKRIIIAIILALVVFGGYKYFVNKKANTPSYQTAVAERGNIITTISTSGTITSGNTTYITTGAKGTISKVYVKNGDTVKKGQKIADITLSTEGNETQTTAWSNYLTTVENEKVAQAARLSADIQMWKDRQAVLDAQKEYDNMKSGGWNPKTNAEYTYNERAVVEKTLELAKLTFSADESKYNNSGIDIALTQAKKAAAYRSYQQVSSSIFAPASGIINNLTLAAGVAISNDSNTSITVSTGSDSTINSVSVTSQRVGAIKDPSGQYQATLTLTEVDVTKIKSGQKVTLTMDAFPDKTLTGTVLAVNTSGSVTSNVTSYSVAVLIDKTDLDVYTNMAVTAMIITDVKNDVIVVSNGAISTSNGNNVVKIMKDNKMSEVVVETGSSNDTQTEIVTGISEGDVVVTGSSTSKANTKNSTSVFGGSGRGGMMGMP